MQNVYSFCKHSRFQALFRCSQIFRSNIFRYKPKVAASVFSSASVGYSGLCSRQNSGFLSKPVYFRSRPRTYTCSEKSYPSYIGTRNPLTLFRLSSLVAKQHFCVVRIDTTYFSTMAVGVLDLARVRASATPPFLSNTIHAANASLSFL